MLEEPQKQTADTKVVFEALFSEYSDMVYRFCLYKTSDKQAAHDLTQDTFMRLWKVMSASKAIEKPKQYIYQIARNLVIDHYKKAKDLSLENLQEVGFDPKDDGQRTDFLAEVVILRQAIDKLEEEYREIIYMRFIEGMGIEDIAEAMDISANLVSVRINRGKKKLQAIFT